MRGCGASPRYPVVFCSLTGCAGFLRGFAPVPRGFGVCKTFGFCILFWQCLLGGRLGPPFFPAGKESAAGGVKKGGQGGLPNGPLDDPPTANKGGCGPLFWINPPGCVSAFESAGGAIYTGRLYCRASAPEARAVDVRACCGAKRFAVARFQRELVLRVGSSGEYVTEVLAFELWALLALVLRQRVASLASCSGELGGGSSFWKRTFICN